MIFLNICKYTFTLTLCITHDQLNYVCYIILDLYLCIHSYFVYVIYLVTYIISSLYSIVVEDEPIPEKKRCFAMNKKRP